MVSRYALAQEYGGQSFQADSRAVQRVRETTADLPGPRKSPGIFTYKGFDCLVMPQGSRFSIIVLNHGNPIQVEWVYYKDKKLRDSWGTVSLAKLNAKVFIRYHLKRKHFEVNETGRKILVLRPSAVRTDCVT